SSRRLAQVQEPLAGAPAPPVPRIRAPMASDSISVSVTGRGEAMGTGPEYNTQSPRYRHCTRA
ncbi:MAG: hypothetical protein ACREMB_09565, partial [Candidatus Rokuibacteriota bacterium]